MAIESYYGGGGLGVYNTALPSSLSAIGSAFDMFLRNQQAELARQAQAIEGDKNRRAQKEAQKEQKKQQKKAQKRQLGMTLGLAGGGALLGGIGAAALAPTVAGTTAAAAPAVAAPSVAGSVAQAASSLGAAASTTPLAAGSTIAAGMPGATIARGAGAIADAALAAPSIAGSQGIINAGIGSLASGMPGAGLGAATAGGSAVPLGAGIGASTGGMSGLMQTPQAAAPSYNSILQQGGYGVRPGAAGVGDRLGIFAGNFLGNFANSLAPGSGNAILSLPNINPQAAYQTGLGLTQLGMQAQQNARQDRLTDSTIQHQAVQNEVMLNPRARPLDPLQAEHYRLQNDILGQKAAGTYQEPMSAYEYERMTELRQKNATYPISFEVDMEAKRAQAEQRRQQGLLYEDKRLNPDKYRASSSAIPPITGNRELDAGVRAGVIDENDAWDYWLKTKNADLGMRLNPPVTPSGAISAARGFVGAMQDPTLDTENPDVKRALGTLQGSFTQPRQEYNYLQRKRRLGENAFGLTP